MGVVSLIAGVLLLTVLIVDVFQTVFVPRGSSGPVTAAVYRYFWVVWRRMSKRAGGSRRRRLLALGGPLLMPLTVLLWALELVLGFALVYLPSVDRLIYSNPKAALEGFPAALYISGYSATTLGVGDVYPSGALLRMLMIVEAGLGFALFSISVAYLLSVYDALQRTNALSLEISRYLDLDEECDAIDALIRIANDNDQPDVTRWLQSTTSSLVEATQAQEQYPLIGYFHVPDDERALPLTLPQLMEMLTVCRTMLDPDKLPRLSKGQSTLFAARTATTYLTHSARALGRKGEPTQGPGDDERRRDHDLVRARLVAAGVPVRPADESQEDYVEDHRGWDADDLGMQHHYGYR